MTKPNAIALPFSEWPLQDQALWKTAVTPNPGLFKKVGWASHLSPATIRLMQANYEIWLGYLKRSDAELDGSSPSQRVTISRLDGWLAELHSRSNRATTIHGRLRGLHDAIRMMEPSADIGFIMRPNGYSLRRILRPEPKWKNVRDSGELLSHALVLFQSGRFGQGYAGGMLAIRDAAIMGLIAAHAPRVESVGSMRLGEQLQRDSLGFSVCFGSMDMKMRIAHGFRAQRELAEVFDFYINEIRPKLAGQRPTDMLWIGFRGEPLRARDIGKIVRRRCQDWFGAAEGPNWLRKCLRTTASLEGPEYALDASEVLAHSPEVSIRHYVKAQASRAVERHGVNLAKLRLSTAPLAASAYGWRGTQRSAGSVTEQAPERVRPSPEGDDLGKTEPKSVEGQWGALVWGPTGSK